MEGGNAVWKSELFALRVTEHLLLVNSCVCVCVSSLGLFWLTCCFDGLLLGKPSDWFEG